MCRLDGVQTEDELSDVHTHFMLYYGRDLVAMQNKKAAEKRRKKQEQQQQRLEEGGASGEELDEEEEKPGISVKQSHKSVVHLVDHCSIYGMYMQSLHVYVKNKIIHVYT